MRSPSHPITQVLVIEDDGELRKVLCESISSAGYAVSEAADGVQASAILRAKPFDLVITDLYMPKRDGFEVIMELHRSRPRTKITATPAHPPRRNMLPAAAWLGARRTIAKPFTPEEMLELIKEILDEPCTGAGRWSGQSCHPKRASAGREKEMAAGSVSPGAQILSRRKS